MRRLHPLPCCQAARTCSRRPFCTLTKELMASALPAMTSWREMLPLRGSVVPAKHSAWGNHGTFLQSNLNATLASARYCLLVDVLSAARPCSKRLLSKWRRTCSRETLEHLAQTARYLIRRPGAEPWTVHELATACPRRKHKYRAHEAERFHDQEVQRPYAEVHHPHVYQDLS